MLHGHLDYFQKSFLGGRLNTKPGDHGIPNVRNRWFILFYHVWESAWIEIHWNNIWLRPRSHTTSHYTWRSVTTLHDFGGELERPRDTFFWALTIYWSWLLALGSCLKWPLESQKYRTCSSAQRIHGCRIVGTGGWDRFGHRQGFQQSSDTSHVCVCVFLLSSPGADGMASEYSCFCRTLIPTSPYVVTLPNQAHVSLRH